MASIYEVAKDHSRRIRNLDKQTAARVFAHYVLAFGNIREEYERILRMAAGAAQRGEAISKSWLRRKAMLEQAMARIGSRLDQLSASVSVEIASAQRAAIDLGSAQAIDTMSAGQRASTGRLSVGATFSRAPVEAMEQMVGFVGDGSPLRAVLSRYGAESREAISETLVTGIVEGKNPRTIAREIRDEVDGNRAKALTISRTEVLRAHRAAAIENYRENMDVLEGWMWMANLDARTCVVCWAMHGTIHPLSEDFGTHPNCFVAGTLVQTPDVVGSTSRWYEGEVIEVETVSGNRLSVTPNHPVLTPAGWIAVGALNEGDDLIQCLSGERVLGAINPDYQNPPSPIEKVAEAFGGTLGVTAATMPTAAEDFHGDGAGSNVHVVRAYRHLRHRIETSGAEVLQDDALGLRAWDGLPRTGRSSLEKGGLAFGLTPYGVVGGPGVPGVLVRRAATHHQAIGRQRVTDGYPPLLQGPNDSGPGDAEGFRDGVDRFASDVARPDVVGGNAARLAVVPQLDSSFVKHTDDGLIRNAVAFCEGWAGGTASVALDKVVKIRRVPFSGHVYNLQTATGWYIANNIVTHNCRCSPIPVIEGMKRDIETGVERFEKLTEEEKIEVLGPGAYARYQRGDITISDLVGREDDRRWGPVRFRRSLKEVDDLQAERELPAVAPVDADDDALSQLASRVVAKHNMKREDAGLA